jgi:ankyrin repeat protein
MMAARNKHTEIIELLKPRVIFTNNELVWALQNEYSEYFEDMHKTIEGEMKLLEPVDISGNTIAHLAAEDGHTSFFKVMFPATQGSADDPMFKILTKKNFHPKSALHVIIEKGNLEMFDVLHERREKASKIEKKAWSKFWDKESQRLLLYACRHGTVEVVHYFLKHRVSPTTRIGGQTPLSCAAEEGNYEIVEYLLNRKVPSTGCGEEETFQALMVAAKCGQTNCVILLLKSRANSLVQSNREYKYLMEAISAGHRETAVALLKHDHQWKEAMSHTLHRGNGVVVTPLTMLIKEMPGVAKIALNKCLSVGTTSVTYDFEFLEHHKSQPGGGNRTSVCDTLRNGLTSLCQSFKKKHSEVLLSTMVKHKRLELLQHPLVSQYISLQWWRLFPFLFANQLVYILFLVLLTVYAILTPRPGPDNQYCSGNFSWNSTGSSNYSENSTAGSCFGKK